jgi:hypothetical protein
VRIPENDRQQIADAIEKLREAYAEEKKALQDLMVANLFSIAAEKEAEDLGVDTAMLRAEAGLA